MIELGSMAKDKHTDFEGTVMAKSEYLYGCRRYALLSKELKDGKPQDWIWFDEEQLVGGNANGKTGGPRPDAPSR